MKRHAIWNRKPVPDEASLDVTGTGLRHNHFAFVCSAARNPMSFITV